MKGLIIASCLLAVAAASVIGHSSQFHVQDQLGQYSYGYAGGPSAKQEVRSADGVTHGGYSYVDGNGHLQSVNYVADDVHGFRVAATNLPQAPVAHLAAPVAVATVAGPVAAYSSPYVHAHHVPVVGHNGVPLDTPEVAVAKANHFAAHAEAHARNAYGPHAIGALPIDTPEVQHAKAAHFAAHVEAAARNGHGLVHYRKRRGAYYAGPYAQHIPVIDARGVPVETPEVQHAKAHHFAAHAEAAARSGYHGGAVHYAHAYPQHIPVIDAHGVPVETPEVQHAKAYHFAAHAQARNGHVGVVTPLVYGHHAYAAQHIPVIGHNGVPLDTPEVAVAKANHFAAHAEAHARNGYGHAHPIDTPEVQHAKAAHFAAHAEANARAHGSW